MNSNAGHVVLLGDSVFDNAAYVGNGPSVIEQLNQILEARWQATLLAVDGNITASVSDQLERLPPSATHLVLSVGGNDALWSYEVLGQSVGTVGEACLRLAAVRDQFHTDYERMLTKVLERKLPTIVCTVYDPNFDTHDEQRMSVAALATFNDVITRAVFRLGLPLIDLRLLFSAQQDYANPIEPSSAGGAKIAGEIVRIVSEHDFVSRRSVVYGG